MQTSMDSPIRVALLPQELLGLPGRLGLTFAPGKKDRVKWDRDLEQDLGRLRSEYHADMLVTLLEGRELALLGIGHLFRRAHEHGLETVWFPIRDFSVPMSMGLTVQLVEMILGAVGTGQIVLIHCRGGIGRTGLVAAACLVAKGHTAAAAIDQVRAVRPGAVETAEQEAFVTRFAATWTGRAAATSG